MNIKLLSNKDPRKKSLITNKIIQFKKQLPQHNLKDVIKWPLKNADKIVLSVKNTNQLKQIININKYQNSLGK